MLRDCVCGRDVNLRTPSLLNKVKENRDNLTLSVYKKNINAINFYKKNDFIITSENIDKDTADIEYTMTWNK